MFSTLTLLSALLLIEPVSPIIVPNPLADDSKFGHSLCWMDGKLVVGSPNTVTADNDGAVFIFQPDMDAKQYDLAKPLIGNPPDPIDYPAKFGWSVSCETGLLVVGAPGEFISKLPNQGAVYTFLYDAVSDIWSEHPVPRLESSSPSASDQFGSATAIADGLLIVGSPGFDDDSNADIGSLANYTLSADQLALKGVTQGLPPVDARLGSALARSGDTIVAVAPGGLPGEARIVTYKLVNGLLQQESVIKPDDMATPACGGMPPDSLESIGTAIGVAGDTLLIGAPLSKGPTDVPSGVVYVFERVMGAWQCVDRIAPETPQANEGFGSSIVLRDDLAIIAATSHTIPDNPTAGALFMFERQGGKGWVQQPGAVFGSAYDEFGCALALQQDRLAVATCGDTPIVTVFTLKASLGEACQVDDECALGLCADGVCCDDSRCVDEQCWRCDLSATAGHCAFDAGGDCEGGDGCIENMCMASGDTTGTGTGDDDSTAGPHSNTSVPTTSEAETAGPATSGNDTAHAPGGPGFDNLSYEGCLCQSQPNGGAAALTCALGLLLLGRRRRRA